MVEDTPSPTPIMLRHVRKQEQSAHPAIFRFWFAIAALMVNDVGEVGLTYIRTGWSTLTQATIGLSVLIWVIVVAGLLLSGRWRAR
jgi:hypothetical protein